MQFKSEVCNFYATRDTEQNCKYDYFQTGFLSRPHLLLDKITVRHASKLMPLLELFLLSVAGQDSNKQRNVLLHTAYNSLCLLPCSTGYSF